MFDTETSSANGLSNNCIQHTAAATTSPAITNIYLMHISAILTPPRKTGQQKYSRNRTQTLFKCTTLPHVQFMIVAVEILVFIFLLLAANRCRRCVVCPRPVLRETLLCLCVVLRQSSSLMQIQCAQSSVGHSKSIRRDHPPAPEKNHSCTSKCQELCALCTREGGFTCGFPPDAPRREYRSAEFAR